MRKQKKNWDGAAPKPESDNAVKNKETVETDGAAPKPESDSAIKKEETEEKADGAAPKPESDSAVKNEETVEKTKSAIKPDVCDVREKLCQTEAQKSDAMEPKQTDSVTDAQKSDVCNEINKSDEVEQPEKLFETDKKSDTMEPKQNESKTEEQKSDVRSEVHEPKPKQIETESVPNESESELIGSKKSDVCKGDGIYTTDESEEYEDNDTNQTEGSYVWTEDSEGDSNSSYESYQLVIENCQTETGKDCDITLCPQCSNSKEEMPSTDGSFEGFDASEIIPKLGSEDEDNKSEGLDGKFDTVQALDKQDNVRKTVHDAINETDNGEPERKEKKVPVVDLSASKVTPKFMAELKKIVNKNLHDALEAEDLLPKPLPVVENR